MSCSGGERESEVHRARLLGVGEAHGRELRVGLLLLRHDVRRAEARRLEHLDDGGAADTVQGRVDELEVARAVGDEAGHGVEVGVDDLVAEHPPGRAARHVGERADGLDPGRDLGVGRGHDLAAVAEVDLVAVVARRVVAGGHHHAGHAAELADRERQQGSGQRAWQHQGAEARPGHHLGGVASEDVGVVPGVVPDHDGGVATGTLVVQVGRQAGRRAADDHAVHPVGAGTELTAETGRPELEGAVEPVGELVGRALAPISASSSARVTGSGSSAAQARARARRSGCSVMLAP